MSNLLYVVKFLFRDVPRKMNDEGRVTLPLLESKTCRICTTICKCMVVTSSGSKYYTLGLVYNCTCAAKRVLVLYTLISDWLLSACIMIWYTPALIQHIWTGCHAMNLLSLVSLCSIILASLSQVKSAETWSLHLVRRGNVTYRPASELTNFTAVRACLVEGFGLQAEPKDLKIFSQNVRCMPTYAFASNQSMYEVSSLDNCWLQSSTYYLHLASQQFFG